MDAEEIKPDLMSNQAVDPIKPPKGGGQPTKLPLPKPTIGGIGSTTTDPVLNTEFFSELAAPKPIEPSSTLGLGFHEQALPEWVDPRSVMESTSTSGSTEDGTGLGTLAGITGDAPSGYVSPMGKTIFKDLSTYKDAYGDNIGYVTEDGSMEHTRAVKQGVGEQASHALLRTAANIIPEIISQSASLLDVEDMANQDNEIGNPVSDYMKGLQESINEALPIYREHPDQAMDFGDAGYWFENGSNLATSVLASAAVGTATGALGSVATGLAGGGKVASALGTVASAALINHTESITIGKETYDAAYAQSMAEQRAAPNAPTRSVEEMETQAKAYAAPRAASAVNANRVNILLNITGANLLMKTPTSINTIVKQTNLGNTFKHIGQEAAQEYAEENINDIVKDRALAEGYHADDVLNYIASERGRETGLLGAIGGAAGAGAAIAKKNLPIHRAIDYNKAFNDAYAKTNPELSTEERTSQASWEAYKVTRAEAKKISENEKQNRKALKQSELLASYDIIKDAPNPLDATSVFLNSQEQLNLSKEYAEAVKANDMAKADSLGKRLFDVQLTNALDNGTIDGFTSLYKAYKDMSQEEAQQRGIYKPGDEKDPSIYYKTKAEKALDTIGIMSKQYLASQGYINSNYVYDLASKRQRVTESIKDVDDQIQKAIAAVQTATPWVTTTTQNLVDDKGETLTPEQTILKKNLNTPEAKALEAAIRSKENLIKTQKAIEADYIEATSKKTQDKISETIRARGAEFNKAKREAEALNKEAAKSKATSTAINNMANNVATTTATPTAPVTQAPTAPVTTATATTPAAKPSIVPTVTPVTPAPAPTAAAPTTTAIPGTVPTPTVTAPKLDRIAHIPDMATVFDTIQGEMDSLKGTQLTDTLQKRLYTLNQLVSNLETAGNTPGTVFKVNENIKKIQQFLEDTSKLQAQPITTTAASAAPTAPAPSAAIGGIQTNLPEQTTTMELVLPTNEPAVVQLLQGWQQELNMLEGENLISAANTRMSQLDNLIANPTQFPGVNIDVNNLKENRAILESLVQAEESKLNQTTPIETAPTETTEGTTVEDDNVTTTIVEDAHAFLDSVDVDASPVESAEEPTELANRIDRNIESARKLGELLKQAELSGYATSLEGFIDFLKGLDTSTDETGNSIIEQKIISKFNNIKRLYEIATESDYDPRTYNEMLGIDEQKGIVEKYDNIALVTLPEGTYVPSEDEITRANLQVYEEAISANEMSSIGNGQAFDYFNKSGANLLAYKAIKSERTFTQGVADNGNIFIKVGHTDLEKSLNEGLDPRVHDPNFLKIGTKIEFYPLDEVRLENGDVLYSDGTKVDKDGNPLPTIEITADNYPIGIAVNGEILKGVYLHDLLWIGRHNIDVSSDAEISKDQEDARRVREVILKAYKNGQVLSSTVTYSSPGILLVGDDAATRPLAPVAERLPNVRVGVINASLQVETVNGIMAVVNKELRAGDTVALIPFGAKFVDEYGDEQQPLVATHTKQETLKPEYIDSIAAALRVYLANGTDEYTEADEAVFKEVEAYGINLKDMNGIRDYINMFVRYSGKPVYSLASFRDQIDAYNIELVPIMQFTTNKNTGKASLFYGTSKASNGVEGYGIPSAGEVGKGVRDNTGAPMSIDDQLQELVQHLEFMPFNISIDGLKRDADSKKMPLISKDGTITTADSYENLVKQNSLTPFTSKILDDGNNTEIYTVQSRKQYDLTSVLQQGEALEKREVETVVTPTTLETEEAPQKDDVNSPFYIPADDMEDFSPIDALSQEGELPADVVKTLMDSSNLIPGVPLSTQAALIDSVIQMILSATAPNINIAFNNVVTNMERTLDANKIALKDRVPALTEILNKIKDNKNVAAREIERKLSRQVGVKVVTQDELTDNSDGVDLTDEANQNEKIFDTPYTVDPITGMSARVRKLLEGTRRHKTNPMTKVSTPVRNAFGLYDYVPSMSVYNNLLTILGRSNSHFGYVEGETNVTTSFDTEDKKQPARVAYALQRMQANLESAPYLADVIETLKNADEITQNEFIDTFSLIHTNHIFTQVIKTEDPRTQETRTSIITSDASTTNIGNLIVSEWQSGLVNVNAVVTVNEKLTLSPNTISTFNRRYEELLAGEITHANLNTMLKGIGITVPVEAFNVWNTIGIYRNNVKMSLKDHMTSKAGLFYNIKEAVNSYDSKLDNPNTLDESSLFDDSAFGDLAYLCSRFRNDLYSKSFRNSNGDTINGFTETRYALSRFFKLKSSKKTLIELSNDVFSESSTWLGELLGKTSTGAKTINIGGDFFRNFKYFSVDSIKLGKGKGVTIDETNPEQLAKFHAGLFFNRGNVVGKGVNTRPIFRFLHPTFSDKSSSIGFQVIGRYFKHTQDGKLLSNDLDYLVDTLYGPEIKRILKAQESEKSEIREYEKGKTMFLLNPALAYIDKLFVEGSREYDPNDETSFVHYGKLRKDVLIDPDTRLQLKIAMHHQMREMMKEQEEAWKKLNIIKETKAGVPYMAFMDSKYYENAGFPSLNDTIYTYVANQAIANMNMQQLSIGDIALFTDLKGKGTTINPYELAYKTSNNIGKRLAADLANKREGAIGFNETFDLLVLVDNKKDSEVYDYTEEVLEQAFPGKGKSMASEYKKMKASDAQEYTSLEEHIDWMYKQHEITSETRDRIKDTYNKTGKVSKKDLGTVLQPVKPVYSNMFPRDGVQSRLYVKSSSFPLIKELTQGTELDKLRELLEDETNNIRRIAYESAVKIGLPITPVNIFNADGTITLPDNLDDAVIRGIPREGHGKQQNVPYSATKQTVFDATQQAKLSFLNLMKVDGFKNPFTGEEMNGRELNEVYLDKYEQLYKLKQAQLIEEIGFDTESGTIGNLPALQEILVNEGKARNFTNNDIESLGLNAQGTGFEVELWLNNADSRIGAMLNSIVDNRVRKRPVHGKSLVLGSSSGLAAASKENMSGVIRVDGHTGDLKSMYNEDGNMVSAEIILPFKFWDNNGQLLYIEDFLNADRTLDMTRVPKELLELYGYRIPTSGINLTCNLKVVGFLPSNMGDLVIAPADFLTQMGSDFDVDKMYTHMYNTWYNSQTKSLEKLTNLHIGKDNYKSEVLQNDLLDLHRAVLANPHVDVQSARVKPLSFGNLPNLVDKFYKPTQLKYPTVLSNVYQQFKYSSARAGKTLVGIFSNSVVFNAASQQVTEPMYFQKQEGEQLSRLSYTIFGKTSNAINDIKTIDGSGFKSNTYEAFMAAALDNENEQMLHKLNINIDTAPVINALASMGYSDEDIIAIIKQPIIEEYVRDKNVGKGFEWDDAMANIMAGTTREELEALINTEDTSSELQEAVLSLFKDLTNRGRELKVLQSAIAIDSTGVGQNLFYSKAKADQMMNLVNSPISNATKLIGEYVDEANLTAEQKENILEHGYTKYQDMYIKPTTIGGFASIYANVLNTQMWSSVLPYATEAFYKVISRMDTYRSRPTAGSASVNTIAKEAQESTKEYKSFLISNLFNLVGNYASIQDARQKLLFTTEKHLGLGSILEDIKSEGLYTNAFLQQVRVGSARQTIDTTGVFPIDIKFLSAGDNSGLDENLITQAISDMIVKNIPLKEYNGKMITTKDLVDMLITHQLITGGIQRSSQFIKYLPFAYLKHIGFYEALSNINSDGLNTHAVNATAKRIAVQRAQHSPELYYNEGLQETLVAGVEGGRLKLTQEKTNRPFIVTRNKPDASVKNNQNEYRIYVNGGDNMTFVQVDNLGYKGISEYDITLPVAGVSNFMFNKGVQINQQSSSLSNLLPVQDLTNEVLSNKEAKKIATDTLVPAEETEQDRTSREIPKSTDEIKQFLSPAIKTDLSDTNNTPIYNKAFPTPAEKFELDNNSFTVVGKYDHILNTIVEESTNPIAQYFAESMKTLVPMLANVPLRTSTTLNAKGEMVSRNGVPIAITINPNKITSDEDMADTLLEEITHAILKQELKDGSSNFTVAINSIRQEMINNLSDTQKEEFSSMQAKVKEQKGITSKERSTYYPLINNDEFIAAAIKDKDFQQSLNNTEATYATKSLWQKFIDAVTKLFNALGVKEDSNLHAVLDNTLAQFKKMDAKLAKDLLVPTYIRTIDFLQDKFQLVDAFNNLVPIKNAVEVTDFINTHIANVTASTVNDRVQITSNFVDEVVRDFSPNVEGMSVSVKAYMDFIEQRLQRIASNIDKANEAKDFVKIATLNKTMAKEKALYEDAKSITTVGLLYDKGMQDYQTVKQLLEKPMTGGEMLYAKSIINFWKEAKSNIFQDIHYELPKLVEDFGEIENKMEYLDIKVTKILKSYTESFIHDTIGMEVNMDNVMKAFGKDIGWIESKGRAISEYDNILLSSIFRSLKDANTLARQEGEKIQEDLNKGIQEVMPIIQSINPSDPWSVFMTKGHKLVTAFTTKFYKDKARIIKGTYADQTPTAVTKAAKWLNGNAVNTKLTEIFPLDGFVTPEVEATREALRQQVGTTVYDNWFKKQDSKLKHYNNNKQGEIEALMGKYNVSSKEDLFKNQLATREYNDFVILNSPMALEAIAFGGKSANVGGIYNNFKYYEVIPSNEKYLDSNYDTIANNPTLLAFYNQVVDLMDSLDKYVPQHQKKELMYGSLPFVEKTVVDMWNDSKGVVAGAEGIWDMFKTSMQAASVGTSVSDIDYATNRPKKSIANQAVKSITKEIKDLKDKKVALFIAKNGKQPNLDELDIIEDEAREEVTKESSKDLGKILKVFTALSMSYAHKSRVEDSIKIALAVLDTYEEQESKPDGTPATRPDGRPYYKSPMQSFVKTKESLTNYIDNIMYGDVKDQEGVVGKGKLKTSKEKKQESEIQQALVDLKVQLDTKAISPEMYKDTYKVLQAQLESLQKSVALSKVGDNVLKYLQVRMMGWNILGGISNMGIGYLSNMIEAAGGQFFNKADMLYAYRLAGHSMAKNVTFNKTTSDTAQKIRTLMDGLDVLKDSNYEVYQDSVGNKLFNKLKYLNPFNVAQRAEYFNQAPILIAIMRNTVVDTLAGKVTLWDAFGETGVWDESIYGAKPEKELNALSNKVDKVIARVHGNYDPMNPIAAKRKFLGRAALQFRTFLLEGIATRYENIKYDPNLESWVKGRHRSVGTLYSSVAVPEFALETLKGLVKQATFNKVFSSSDFSKFVDTKDRLLASLAELNDSTMKTTLITLMNDTTLTVAQRDKKMMEVLMSAPTTQAKDVNHILDIYKSGVNEIDAINMRKVCAEVVMYAQTMSAILLLTMLGGADDDDEEKKRDQHVYNITMNMLTRMSTDLSLYTDPNEAKSIMSDIIPCMVIVENIGSIGHAIFKATMGEDAIETGVTAGDSRLTKELMKVIPVLSKVQSTRNSAIQVY